MNAPVLTPTPHSRPLVAPLLRTLFSPLRIGGVELPNRVLMNGLHLGFERRPDPYASIAHFYRLRARGEVGLLLAGGCSPNRAGRPMPEAFSIEADDLIPRHRAICEAVRQEGGRIALQLVHFGREAFHADLVAPEAKRAANNLFRPARLTEEQIEQTIEDFAQACRRAEEAGYHGVELVGSQGFLLHQFLARHINGRTDGWGGDTQGRLRFVQRLVRACRDATGSGFPLIFRLPALDLMPDCNDAGEVLQILDMVRDSGADMINVGIGTHESPVPTISMVAPPGAFSQVARFVRDHAEGLPVAVSNRINDPRLAEALLLEGAADMVAVGRPLLADRDFVAKARRNDFAAINTCIACNQACLDKALFGEQVGCTTNPDCGAEHEGQLPPAVFPRRHAVVGGGIAGLVAAVTLAERGHRVELFERSPRLGGQMLLASRIPGKGEFARTVQHYAERLNRLGVPVRFGRSVDPAELRRAGFDHVVVATGTAPRAFDLSTDGSVRVLSYEEVLSEELPLPYPALVIGGGGIALDVALYLASRRSVFETSERFLRRNVPTATAEALCAPAAPRRAVTILQRSMGKLARRVGATTRWGLLLEMKRLEIGHIVGAEAVQIARGQVQYRLRSGETFWTPAKAVITAVGQVANRSLADALRQAGLDHSLVGGALDAEGVNITQSVHGSYAAARAL